MFHFQPWAAELSGILPLSALIDFIRGPNKLHMLQLSGIGPIWSWAVTPAMSRLLLGTLEFGTECFLDRFGNSLAIECLDGRYGDRYYAASPETLRLCLATRQPILVENRHQNMALPESEKRPHRLEVVHVARAAQSPSGNFRAAALSLVGWVMILGGITCSALFGLYFATAFLSTVILTGVVVSARYGSSRRKLLVDKGSEYQRLVITSSHMNATSWYLICGESSLVNSLLNRSLTWEKAPAAAKDSWILRLALRGLLAGQWACAVGAAAVKDLNGCFITFWILFCIVSHSYICPPTAAANAWMSSTGEFDLTRYSTTLSSRRTLLNVILAMNTDAYEPDPDNPGRIRQRAQGLRCLDPILATGDARTEWEVATLSAMNQLSKKGASFND